MNQKGQGNIGLYIFIGTSLLLLCVSAFLASGFAKASEIENATNNFCIENGFQENARETFISGKCLKTDEQDTIKIRYYRCEDIASEKDIFIEIGECKFVEVIE